MDTLRDVFSCTMLNNGKLLCLRLHFSALAKLLGLKSAKSDSRLISL